MTVGERIKYLRVTNNLTQTDVARALKIATQTICKYEKNIVTSIPNENIEKLADLFAVSPAYLMGWDAPSALSLTEKEEQLIQKYRDNPSMQKAVDTLLGIE